MARFLFSRKIKQFSYDQEQKILTIEFNTGSTYKYSSVPEKVYEELNASKSPDEFYDEAIYGVYALA